LVLLCGPIGITREATALISIVNTEAADFANIVFSEAAVWVAVAIAAECP